MTKERLTIILGCVAVVALLGAVFYAFFVLPGGYTAAEMMLDLYKIKYTSQWLFVIALVCGFGVYVLLNEDK